MEVKSTVRGLDILAAKLNALPDNVARNCQAKVFRKVLNDLKQKVEANVPVVEGELKKSIRISLKYSKRVKEMGFSARKLVAASGSLVIAAPHAHLVEFGHRMIGHKPGKKPTKKERVPPHKFVRNVWDDEAEKQLNAVLNELQIEIFKAAR
ncbi:conserved hypothetical protein [Gammaproteobacteria bacterium]